MSQRHPQHRRGTNHLSSPRQLLQLINSGRVAQLGEHLLCKQGVAGSNPVTSTNFFLIAKELEKSPRPERSVIRAHCARTVHECVIGAPLCTMERSKKHRPPPPVPFRSLDG